MDPAYLNPIMLRFPDVGPLLVAPLVFVGVAVLAGMAAILALVLRGREPRRDPDVAVVLDAVACSVVEGPRAHDRGGR